MITNYCDDTLRSLGVKEEYFLFCQLWKELTDERTFDSYQYKSFNIINGIEELIHNIDSYLNGFVATTHSICSVSEELIKHLRRDVVLSAKFPGIKNLLLKYLPQKRESVAEFKALRHQLSLYYKELSNGYDEALIDTLADHVGNKKTDTSITLSATYISRCIDIGWSTKALSSKLDLNEGKQLKDFLNRIFYCPKQTYCFFFPFRQIEVIPPKGKTKEDSKIYVKEQLNKFCVSVLSKEAIIAQYSELNSELLKENEYICVTSKCKDIYSASHDAIITLSNVLNILSFFSAIGPWSIKNKTWVGYNTEAPYTITLRPLDIYRTYEYLDSSSTVYNRIERLIHTEADYSELYQKLLSAFSYTNLSHASMTVEEKYMNMWIALESLTRTDSHDGIISNIIQCVPNACSLRYIYRELRNFAEDCGRCNISLDFETIKIDLQDANKEQIVLQMLSLFRNETYRVDLIERCKICTLLSYRCQQIYNLVVDENNMIAHIKSHHQTIEWHLDRLYRIRNEIAHSALFQHVAIVRYTEHLYDYLATYISEIVRFACKKDITSFGTLSAAINDNYQEFEIVTNDKKVKDKKALLGNLWTSGIMNFI